MKKVTKTQKIIWAVAGTVALAIVLVFASMLITLSPGLRAMHGH